MPGPAPGEEPPDPALQREGGALLPHEALPVEERCTKMLIFYEEVDIISNFSKIALLSKQEVSVLPNLKGSFCT